MKLVTWNVNGIRAVAKKGFHEFISRVQPDVLCIQETKAHPDQIEPELLNPFGYKSYWCSASRPGYSGTVTYTKLEPRKVVNGFGVRKFDSEGRTVCTEFDDFTLYNIYFPNGSSGLERHNFKQEFLSQLTTHLVAQMKRGKQIIVVGDYNVAHENIDVYDPVQLRQVSGFLDEERAWFTQFLNSGFVDAFRMKNKDVKGRYTWWNYIDKSRLANRGWRLDYICMTSGLAPKVLKCEILDDVMGSDHCPVMVELQE